MEEEVGFEIKNLAQGAKHLLEKLRTISSEQGIT